MMGFSNDFMRLIYPTRVNVINFHGQDWYVLTDDGETWFETENHCVLPAFDINAPDFNLHISEEDTTFLQGVVSPKVRLDDKSMSVEEVCHSPFMGTRMVDELVNPQILSKHVCIGEIILPLMPVDVDKWRIFSQKNNMGNGGTEESFSIPMENFILLVGEHQKACNRFAYALWSLNWQR